MEETQEQKVYRIVCEAGHWGIRTEEVKRMAMEKGCSCADRFLRWLREKGRVYKTR